MSIREGLSRNRHVYDRLLGQRELREETEEIRLPERGPDTLLNPFEEIAPQTVSLSSGLQPEAASSGQTVSFSLGQAAPPDHEEAAEHLLQLLEREARFGSQDLHGEEA